MDCHGREVTSVENVEIAKKLNQVATLLEMEDANPFRIRAYREASRIVGGLSRPITQILDAGGSLTAYRGIGKDLAATLEQLAREGSFPLLEELERHLPPALLELTELPGLGAKKIKALHQALDIKSLHDLEQAAEQHRIAKVPGFGEKTQRAILEGIRQIKERGEAKRFMWIEAEKIAMSVVEALKPIKDVGRIEIAGSYRRHQETVGDLDIVATCQSSDALMERFTTHESVAKIVSKGETRSTVILRSGMQVDLRAVPAESYGSALVYFTGSKAHNIAIRERALKYGLKVNEYGVFEGRKLVAGDTERSVYGALKLDYIEPELRENHGELEAAARHKLPRLLTLDDIRGDLHSHTTATDGRNSLVEMAKAAQAIGYDYLAITEHSKRVRVAKGLGPDELLKHVERIDKLNDKLKDIRLLKSIEVDILADGSLDLPDQILERLDLRVCSVHYNRNMPRQKMTARILRAMDNPNFNILGHPTGRLINEREAFDVDLEKVFEAAKERGCFIEMNAQPSRLDLDDRYARLAKDMGVKLAISSDAHSVEDLKNMRLGVWQARRGWIEAADVINTHSWSELRRLLKR